uniref:Uncharacterized protein n=1 Tax=Amphimedon queenslandica TaxID=400682 RepID=A0A1X7SUY8_AMPQE
MLDGVLSHSDAHFWQQSSTQVVGTVHVQVAPSASEQKTAHMITQLFRNKGLALATLQIEKPPFVQSGQRVSYMMQHQSMTQPHVYVDTGPHVIKNV